MIKNTAAGDQDHLLQLGLARLKITLEEESIRNLLAYVGELRKWNRHINLIARKTDAQEIIEKHFLDSLTLLFFLRGDYPHREILLDVGTGAGFPGLVLAAALPQLQVILVEPRLKRVSFLRHIIRLLTLENVEVIGDRLEAVSAWHEREITWVTSRAVADPVDFLSMVKPLLDRRASVLLMLSSTQKNRLAGNDFSDKMIVEECRDFILPFTQTRRTVCKVIKNTQRA
ncbi:MAG TPA: 16S rRNA (guanine(527)-N(7))-methyltransferase RsmG [Desulfobulbaceae bacterium]|nr:16S rRNA (guanine(527)-N(7))-methyltransferase RsmG [Desulfobulbaceae bacterium]